MKSTPGIVTSLLNLGALAALCLLAALAQTNATAQTNAAATEEEPRFKAGEKDFSPFGVYTDQAGGKWGAGAALTYFVTDKIGAGLSSYWTELGGTFFDNLEGEGYFRLPLLKVIAPYAVGGVGYQFDRHYGFETIGLGLDFRAFKHLDAFGDLQYRFSNDDDKSKSGTFLRLGVRLTF
jgi:hypothetical protein